MMHLLGFYVGSSGTTANTQLPALSGDIFTRTNGNFLPQRGINVYAAYCGGATLTHSRIVTPKLRQVTIPYILPVTAAAIPPTNPNIMDLRANPLQLDKLEEFEMQYTDSAGSDKVTGLAFIGDQFRPAPAGQVLTMRGTSTTAAVSNAWTTLTVTWPDSLPNGRYAIVGFKHFCTNAIAARLIIDGQDWRPGCLSIGTVTDKPSEISMNGGLGEVGRFEQTAMPQVEVLVNGTDADSEVFVQIVRVG